MSSGYICLVTLLVSNDPITSLRGLFLNIWRLSIGSLSSHYFWSCKAVAVKSLGSVGILKPFAILILNSCTNFCKKKVKKPILLQSNFIWYILLDFGAYESTVQQNKKWSYPYWVFFLCKCNWPKCVAFSCTYLLNISILILAGVSDQGN